MQTNYRRPAAARMRIIVDLNRDHRNTVFLAGTGRSGTSWVANIINYDKHYRFLYEPFHPDKVPLCRNFRPRQYLRPDDTSSAFLEPARAILTGAVRNSWVDAFNTRMVATRRLIKDIRANFLLKWMQTNFPGMPIILLLRHPCADANSRIQLGWQTDLRQLLDQPELMQDFLEPFRQDLTAASTDFEKHVLLWCAENYVPLKQFAPDEIHLAFYEDFCERPKREIDRLFRFLGRSYDRAVFDELERPSELSREESPILRGGSLIDSWREQVSEAQIARALEIVHLFGLDGVYSAESMPNLEGAHALMKASGTSASAHQTIASPHA